LPHKPKHVELPPVTWISQSCVTGGLAVGSTVRTSFQFSRVITCWIASAAFAAAFSAATVTGFGGRSGTASDTAEVVWMK
jgi:hypothetical protein